MIAASNHKTMIYRHVEGQAKIDLEIKLVNQTNSIPLSDDKEIDQLVIFHPKYLGKKLGRK